MFSNDYVLEQISRQMQDERLKAAAQARLVERLGRLGRKQAA